MKFRAVSGQGYPEELIGPATDAETAEMARRHRLNAADDATRKPLGAPNYRKPAAPPGNRMSGYTAEECARLFLGESLEEDAP